MKKTFPFVPRHAWLPAGCLLALCLLTGMEAIKPAAPHGPVKKDYQVTTTVRAAQLRKAFERARRKELSIYLYVVKSSPDKNSRDVHVIWCVIDSGSKPVFAEKGWSNELLAKESGWYVHYLRLNGVVEQDVVMGYYVRVDPKKLATISGLQVDIHPFQGIKNRLNLKVERTEPRHRRIEWLDSCKIPPGCNILLPSSLPALTSIVNKEYSNH